MNVCIHKYIYIYIYIHIHIYIYTLYSQSDTDTLSINSSARCLPLASESESCRAVAELSFESVTDFQKRFRGGVSRGFRGFVPPSSDPARNKC